MRRIPSHPIGIAAVASALLAGSACSGDRTDRTPATGQFQESDAGDCVNRCSLDGSALLRCTGEVEPCPAGLTCGGGRCQEPCAAAAAEGSTNGCEFYMQPPLVITHNDIPYSCYAAYLVNTSPIPLEAIELEFEGEVLDVSKALYRTVPSEATLTLHEGPIPSGEGVILFISDRPVRADRPPAESVTYIPCPEGAVPALIRDYYPEGTQFGSSFHLTTSAPVSTATVYPFGGAASYAPSATLLYPVASWSKENLLVGSWESWQWFEPGVQIVASEDDTDVTLLPSVEIQDGKDILGTPAGVPATYRLDKGQFLQLVQPRELTGTTVSSTKPTSTFAIHSAMRVPSNVATADVVGAQIPAFDRWGSEYVGVGYRPRNIDEHEPLAYRIVAARDGTRLDYDPEIPRGAPVTLNAGEMATFASGVGDPFVVRTQDAEHPVYLAAYMTGANGDFYNTERGFHDMGDPEMVGVVAAEQYLTTASFYADPTYVETSLVVIRAKTEGDRVSPNGVFEDVTLSCLDGPVPNFHPIGTRGVYEYARVDLSKRRRPGDGRCYYGAHHLRSKGLFSATIWGWDSHASYAYASGMSLRKLVSSPLIAK